jgi:hypothetical protein
VPVKVTIHGYTYGTTIAVYDGKSYLGVRREVREAAVAVGEHLMVGLEYDAELRTVDLPDALRSALQADAAAAAAFEKLSYTFHPMGNRGKAGGDPASADGASDGDAAGGPGAAMTLQAAWRCRRA